MSPARDPLPQGLDGNRCGKIGTEGMDGELAARDAAMTLDVVGRPLGGIDRPIAVGQRAAIELEATRDRVARDALAGIEGIEIQQLAPGGIVHGISGAAVATKAASVGWTAITASAAGPLRSSALALIARRRISAGSRIAMYVCLRMWR